MQDTVPGHALARLESHLGPHARRLVVGHSAPGC